MKVMRSPITINLTVDTKQELEDYTQENDITKSGLIEGLLKDFLSKGKAK